MIRMSALLRLQLAGCLICLLMVSTARSAEIDFVNDIRPIFEKHCYACHAGDEQKSGFRLDIKSAAFAGGDLYDSPILPGQAQESYLVLFTRDKDGELVMPPEGDGLSPSEVATLTKWIDTGANWPDGVDLVKAIDKRDHWSFKPIADPTPPPVQSESWPRDAMDRFILARLDDAGLKPSAPASRREWLRRLTYDLTGLPPTPDELERFLADERPTAFETVVDRLLASPRYGERWAQHWLDVVRYADTHGFEVNTERPNAWPYRDYVIAAFNRDTPYDQFVREQLAGDQFGHDAATGFLVTASVLLPGQIGKDEESKRLARQDSLDEIVTNIGQTFLGMSIGCARCHDHKFDPITQQEYYSMQAFVAGVEYRERDSNSVQANAARAQISEHRNRLAEIDHTIRSLTPLASVQPDRIAKTPKRTSVNAELNIDRISPVVTKQIRFAIHETNNLEPCIDEFEIISSTGENVALASFGTTVIASGSRTQPNRHQIEFVNDGQYGNSRSWMSNEVGKGWLEFRLPEPVEIERIQWGRDRTKKYKDRLAIDYEISVGTTPGDWQLVASSQDRAEFDPNDKGWRFRRDMLDTKQKTHADRLLNEKKKLTAEIARLSKSLQVFAGRFRQPDEIRVLRRGDPEQPLELVAAEIPDVFGSLESDELNDEPARREALADWIVDKENPLTARVMVNRIWQSHFGMGLVDTPNDFGRIGTLPSHPQLLDFLSREFMRAGWSMKTLHRRIVLSATYRQSSLIHEDGTERDADVRLLWRYPTRRLDGESIRDSILQISGELNQQAGGPGFDLFDKRGGLTGFKPVEVFPENGLRRMIYAHRVRRERDRVFGAFDCPDGGQSAPRRRNSTTPIQALNLLNSRFVIDQSNAFAKRVTATHPQDVTQQIRMAFVLALGREPSAEETQAFRGIIEQHGLPTLCRALFNSNEFLFIP